ncbi:hypothetical protein SAMN04487910_2331 [Aquimarina amphilecti]|uniref:Uncharacterized protein n=1 Tax=Aquimarina amphilecti TaxID=1038014 RepID=A0A1H7PVJ0_AQUAM|nr:hypothetical protein [Aquimarina amphilecti]SEL39488.1 hypothetical protein SAMN04487910_2331 [Aquimarina amphilecti]
MKTHFDLDDIEFKTSFENGTLDPSLFNHEAHLRLAWIHIKLSGDDIACETITNQILSYVTKLNAIDKFNKTLTIAAVKIVNYYIQKSKSNNFKEFIAEFPGLKNNFKGLVDTHYSIDIFNSEEAKTNYLAPDLIPFL